MGNVKEGQEEMEEKEKDYLDCWNENRIYQWKENIDTSNSKRIEKGSL